MRRSVFPATRSLPMADRARLLEILQCTGRLQKERRARVLRHGDLAAMLCGPPLLFARPEQWSGYVPPATGQAQMPEILHSGTPWVRGGPAQGRANASAAYTGPTELNGSPYRDALVAICAQAWARAVADGTAGPSDAEVLAGLPFPVIRAGDPGGPQHQAASSSTRPPWQAPLPEPPASQDGWPDGSHGQAANR